MQKNHAEKMHDAVENNPAGIVRRFSVLTGLTRILCAKTDGITNITNWYKNHSVGKFRKNWSLFMVKQSSLSITLFCDKVTFTEDGINNLGTQRTCVGKQKSSCCSRNQFPRKIIRKHFSWNSQ